MAWPTAEQWTALCEGMADAAERLRRDGPDLLQRSRYSSTRDGYPSQASGLAQSTISTRFVGDQVGNLAAHRVDEGERSDSVRSNVVSMYRHAERALRELEAADGARARALPGDVPEPEPLAPGCDICDRFGFYPPVHKAGRCRACYEWRRRHGGEDAPEHVIREREEIRKRRVRADPGPTTAAVYDLDEARRRRGAEPPGHRSAPAV